MSSASSSCASARRSAAICWFKLFSSTAMSGHTAARSVSFGTTVSACSSRTTSVSAARPASAMRRSPRLSWREEGSKRNSPNSKAIGPGIASLQGILATTRHRMRQHLGPYRILHTLGEGGMGIVYAAEDSRLGRAVALKTVRREIANDETRERLRREARAAAAISHPNVCQLYEIGEHDGELFIAMELLEGEPLSARVARGPLPVA